MPLWRASERHSWCWGLVVAAVGPPISQLSLTPLRLIVGGLLLIFGIQWLRKAMLRSSGYKAMHDEEVIYNSARVSALAGTSRSILRRLLVRHCLQGCIPRGPRGRLHRSHLRGIPTSAGYKCTGCVIDGGGRGGGRGSNSSTAEPRAREHPEVRRGDTPDIVRDVLGG